VRFLTSCLPRAVPASLLRLLVPGRRRCWLGSPFDFITRPLGDYFGPPSRIELGLQVPICDIAAESHIICGVAFASRREGADTIPAEAKFVRLEVQNPAEAGSRERPERVLARGRALLAVVFLAAIYLDCAEPSRSAGLAYSSGVTREVYLHSVPADARVAIQQVEDLFNGPDRT